MRTLTSANSSFALAVPPAIAAPQLLKGYATDDTFMVEAVEEAQVLMGVDGKLSGGFVFNPFKMTITLQADSESNDLFSIWSAYQRATKEVAVASATIILPSVSKKFICSKGFLTSKAPFPDAKKILQPRRYQITWELIIEAPN
jgi:hypothetical protein